MFVSVGTVNGENFESLRGSRGISDSSSSLTSSGSTNSDGGTGGTAAEIPSGTPAAQPKFMSRGHLYKVVVGDTIELPCKVQNLGKIMRINVL